MPTFRKLSVFKDELHQVSSALAPLCTLTQLLELSREDHQSLARRIQADEVPRWIREYERWMDSVSNDADTAEHGFLNLIEDSVDAAVQELSDSLRSEHPEFSDRFANLLVETLPVEALTEIVVPTALLVYRRDYAKDTVEEFAGRLKDDNVRQRIYEEFPLVARLTTEVLIDWRSSTIELVDNILNDKEVLWRSYSFDVEKISCFRANLGDRHKNGGTVTIIEAGERKVVYKPRAAFGEVLIDKVCDLLPEIGELLPLRPLVVERDGYFWQEHVAANDFTPNQAPLIARKLGVLNAILYFLMADDMHHENVQICGGDVAVLDAECVLNVLRPIDFMTVDVENVGARALADAAYTVGIVPQPVHSKDSSRSRLDISVVGYKPGGTVGLNVPQLSRNDAGELALINGPAKFDEPDPIAARSSLLHCGADFIHGFRLAADALVDSRDEIIRLIDDLAEAVVRVLPRPTMIYSKILLESYHPTFMRDAGLRDACLGKLLPRYYGKPYRQALISAEMSALRSSFIPFTQLDVKRNVLMVGGRRIVLREDSLGRLMEHIRGIDDDEIDRQCCYLDMAFASAVLKSSRPVGVDLYRTPVGGAPASGMDVRLRMDELIARAVERCSNFLVRSNGEVGFATMNALAPDCWVMGPAGTDLYNGLAGVHLMLDRVTRTSVGMKYRELFQDVANTASRFGEAVTLDSASIEKNIRSLNVGLFDQLSGIAISQYLSLHKGGEQVQASESLRRTVLMLCEMVPHDENFDVISGSAGAVFLGCLISNSYGLPRPVAESCDMLVELSIERLLASIRRSEGSAFWATKENPSGLTGLSHGAAGVAAALVFGAKRIDRRLDECVDAACAALAWERSMFDDTFGWADLRPEAQQSAGAEPLQAWCHGSGGAYIARSIIRSSVGKFLTVYDLEMLDREISFAVNKLASKTESMIQGGGSDCLCHGTLGNLLVLQQATKAGEYDEDRFESLLRSTIARAERDGWRFGGLPGLYSNGFMMGLPGIVWGLSSLQLPGLRGFDPLLLGL